MLSDYHNWLTLVNHDRSQSLSMEDGHPHRPLAALALALATSVSLETSKTSKQQKSRLDSLGAKVYLHEQGSIA